MTIKVKLVCLSLTCFLSLASGCVEISTLYHGKTVSSVPVVTLQEGSPTSGTWKTFDLTIDYKYIKKGDSFEISGQAALSQHYQMLHSIVSKMRAYIFFLDKDSRVLETAYFVNDWTSSTEDVQVFSKSYKVPTGTTGVSFGYSGEARESESNEYFYKLPLK